MSVILKGRGNNGATSCAFRPLAQFMCGGSSLSLSLAERLLLTRVRSFPNAIRSRLGRPLCVSLQTLAGRERRSVAEHIQCALLFLSARVIIKRSDGRTMARDDARLLQN